MRNKYEDTLVPWRQSRDEIRACAERLWSFFRTGAIYLYRITERADVYTLLHRLHQRARLSRRRILHILY